MIRQHNDAPSIYKAWRDEGREGLHHVCILVDDLQYDAANDSYTTIPEDPDLTRLAIGYFQSGYELFQGRHLQ